MRGHGWGDHLRGHPGSWGPAKFAMGAAGIHGFGPPGFTRGPKARRGDVRVAILDVLAARPMNGYQIIQQIAERSGGAWKPSPGSVYPTLQQLEDEGLVQPRATEGRRLLQLTDDGRAYVENNPDELAATWAAFEQDPDDAGELRPLIGQVMAACWQVAVTGTAQQQAQASQVLSDTRRRLYGLLAEGDPQ